ncbi:MAG: cation diffusion facilitator family transporter [bacterium]
MSESHSHRQVGYKLGFSIGLNLLITVVQVAGGLLSGSLSLLSDALHNFIDTFSLVTSYIAHKLSIVEHTRDKTYGYKRAEILVALFNAAFLIVASIFLFKEAGERLLDPVAVNSRLVFIVGGIGLVANSFSAFLLQTHTHDNMNVRSAFFHLFADALVSLAVIVGALAMHFWGIYRVDPLLTLLIGAYIVKEGYEIVKDAVNILMQNVPEEVDLEEIKADIEELEGIENIHHVHVWAVTENDIHLEGHVNTNRDFKLSKIHDLQNKIKEILDEKYSIHHPTLQFEYNRCDDHSLIKNKPEK